MNEEEPQKQAKTDPMGAYAGRWVARVGERLIAQGGTPGQALQQALAARYKEKPTVTYIATERPLIYPPILDSLVNALADEKRAVYLVGGTLRDALLGRQAHDLDVCLAGDPIGLARRVANRLGGAFYVLDDERGAARVILSLAEGERYSIDFAGFRGSDLEADLAARDFTINAIAADLRRSQQLLDPLGGAADLKKGLIRACSPTSFQEDPLRILRGIRLAADLGFHIVPDTRQAMKAAVGGLEQVSAERKRDELFRILEGPRPAVAIRALDRLGCLPFLLPELQNLKGIAQSAPHVHDVWEHTLAVLAHLETLLDVLIFREKADANANLMMGQAALMLGRYREAFLGHMQTQLNPNRSIKGLLMLAALYHDIAKPVTSEADAAGRIHNLGHEKIGGEAALLRAHGLQLSNPEADTLRVIIRAHMRIHSLVQSQGRPTPRAIYRFFRDTGEAGIDVILLSLADTLATYETTLPADTWTAYLEAARELCAAYWERPNEVIHPVGLVNGNDLQAELQLAPGPRLGLLLEAIREAQVEDKVHDREEALEFARKWLAGEG